MEKVSSSLTVLAEKSNEKGLILEFHLGGHLKMQIRWRKTFHFFHFWRAYHFADPGQNSHRDCQISDILNDPTLIQGA